MRFCLPILQRSIPFCLSLAFLPLNAQQVQEAPTTAEIAELVSGAVAFQQQDMLHEGWAVRYRVHRVDHKEDSVREIVETSEGNVARTVQRDGKPLTSEQQAAEVHRLQLLAQAGKRHRGSDPFARYGNDLVSAMPTAMDYTWSLGQPQLSSFNKPQIVLDYQPRSSFQPSSAVQSLLKGLAGRIWIDSQTHHLLRIEVNVVQDLDLALGLLARVHKGGKLTYEQAAIGGGHDAYRSIDIDVRLRELMVKTTPYHLTLETSDRRLLPSVPSFKEGIAMLLAE